MVPVGLLVVFVTGLCSPHKQDTLFTVYVMPLSASNEWGFRHMKKKQTNKKTFNSQLLPEIPW